MGSTSVTRGHGVLEGVLAWLRARKANRLIAPAYRTGRILDIGCGTSPFFLKNTTFREKYGVDQVIDEKTETIQEGLVLRHMDVEEDATLPFPDDFFDVVTMLAVFEHLVPDTLPGLLDEVHRVLKPGGLYVMTTPARWSDGLLKWMARFRLVSPVEIDEHQDAYDHPKIRAIFEQTRFDSQKVHLGYFELFLNLYATARKALAESQNAANAYTP